MTLLFLSIAFFKEGRGELCFIWGRVVKLPTQRVLKDDKEATAVAARVVMRTHNLSCVEMATFLSQVQQSNTIVRRKEPSGNNNYKIERSNSIFFMTVQPSVGHILRSNSNASFSTNPILFTSYN